jgi:AcrR family transcriptional regulator
MAVKPTRRREEPAVRRAQVLTAAKALFRRGGFHPTGIDAIAKAAGVSVGLIYTVFPSKEAILEAIVLEDVDDQIDAIFAAVMEIEADPAKPSTGIRRLMEWCLDRERTMMMLEIAAEVMRNPKLRVFVQENRVRLRQAIGERLCPGRPDDPAIDGFMLRLDLVNAVAQGVAVQHAVNDWLPDETALDVIVEMTQGILSKSVRL